MEYTKCFLAFLQVRKSGHLDVDVWTLSKNFFSWLGNRVKTGNVKNQLLIYLILIYNIYIIYKYCFLL